MTDLETLAHALSRVSKVESARMVPRQSIIDLCQMLTEALTDIHRERGWQFEPEKHG